ncbi:MAG: FAD-dependent oxidoreductase [Chloroflexi bacterium]|nr:FAD-dependent oxidoreductase [Chloroflexota bacterium]
MSGQSADVVICGGGALGAALAYELAGRGVRPLLVESRAIASGASGKAAGLLSPASDARAAGPLGPLWRASLARHHALVRELDAHGAPGYGFEESPSLLITADAAEAETLREAAPSKWLEPDEVRARCAWIDGPIEGGLLREASAEVQPAAFTQALIRAAESRGARVEQGRVTGLSVTGGGVTGVRVDGEVIRTDAVVLAMGPWTSEVGAWLGLPVPVTPLKGQILRLRLPPAQAETRFSDTDGNYMARKADGLVYVGTTEESVGFDETPTVAARRQILRQAGRFVSAVSRAEVVKQTACLRPLSPDGLPILGAAPGLSGAYIATGHGRAGLLLAPGSAAALAAQITGEPPAIDLTPFDPARFA